MLTMYYLSCHHWTQRISWHFFCIWTLLTNSSSLLSRARVGNIQLVDWIPSAEQKGFACTCANPLLLQLPTLAVCRLSFQLVGDWTTAGELQFASMLPSPSTSQLQWRHSWKLLSPCTAPHRLEAVSELQPGGGKSGEKQQWLRHNWKLHGPWGWAASSCACAAPKRWGGGGSREKQRQCGHSLQLPSPGSVLTKSPQRQEAGWGFRGAVAAAWAKPPTPWARSSGSASWIQSAGYMLATPALD